MNDPYPPMAPPSVKKKTKSVWSKALKKISSGTKGDSKKSKKNNKQQPQTDALSTEASKEASMPTEGTTSPDSGNSAKRAKLSLTQDDAAEDTQGNVNEVDSDTQHEDEDTAIDKESEDDEARVVDSLHRRFILHRQEERIFDDSPPSTDGLTVDTLQVDTVTPTDSTEPTDSTMPTIVSEVEELEEVHAEEPKSPLAVEAGLTESVDSTPKSDTSEHGSPPRALAESTEPTESTLTGVPKPPTELEQEHHEHFAITNWLLKFLPCY